MVRLADKEHVGMGGVNRTIVVGQVGTYGVEVRYSTNGTPCASFTLAVSELGQDGREHTTLIPCEIWGKKAEVAADIEAGALVCFEGKLRRRQKADQTWELCVSGYEVTPITAPLPTLTGEP
jgi:single stranded DNA-binding protein